MGGRVGTRVHRAGDEPLHESIGLSRATCATARSTRQVASSSEKIRRLGVRYIDRVHEQNHLERLGGLLRPEILGPYNVRRPEAVGLNNVIMDCDYRFSDESALRARWGFLGPSTTFDPAIAPVDSPSWVLDLGASHGERDFDPAAIADQVQLFTDRIYRYFRWTVTDEFLYVRSRLMATTPSEPFRAPIDAGALITLLPPMSWSVAWSGTSNHIGIITGTASSSPEPRPTSWSLPFESPAPTSAEERSPDSLIESSMRPG